MKTFLILIATVFFSCITIAQQNPSPGEIWINPEDGMKFVWIPPGSIHVQIPIDTNDATKVRDQDIMISRGFWLGQTEVTVKQFRKFIRETGYVTTAELGNEKFTWCKPGIRQKADHPVVFVSVEDANAYADWSGVDLPYELEWIYACRARTSTNFYWGDTLDNRYVWHRANSVTGTRPVAKKLPNPWGLYDMVGNVWEFTWVCEGIQTLKGGSWTRCHAARAWWGPVYHGGLDKIAKPRLTLCRSSIYNPVNHDDDRGFRCILRLQSYEEIEEQVGDLSGIPDIR